MKKISDEQHKKILIGMLDKFHKYCVEHEIKYSLIGGSLIGAVREGGIIPWDDDIDVILMPEEYEKLLYSLKRKSIGYDIVSYDTLESYCNLSIKVVDGGTVIKERGRQYPYGVFLDVFRYNYVPNNKIASAIYYVRYKTKLSIVHGFLPDRKNERIVERARNAYSSLLDRKKYLRKFDRFLTSRNGNRTSRVIPNGVVYSFSREMQDTDNLLKYKIVKFNGIDAMIFENYDRILRHVFGDYMTPPPKEKRTKKHEIITYKK